MTLVNATTNGKPNIIKRNADKFIEDYGAYTPMVSGINVFHPEVDGKPE
jgi:hypothetical protein